MKWDNYLQQLANENNEMSDLQISINGEEATVPAIVRVSIAILDKMLENNSIYNIFVFPEKEQTIFLFVIMKLLHDISSGRIGHNYDPSSFVPGTKLRFGKAVCEFVSFMDDNNGQRIKLKFAPERKNDGPAYSTSPIEIVPVLQHTDTTKPLSKESVFSAEKKAWKEKHSMAPFPDILEELDTHKTHMENSVFYMSTLVNVHEQFASTAIHGRKITDMLLVSQAKSDGQLTSISSKKISGVPAFILSPDLYGIRTAIEAGARGGDALEASVGVSDTFAVFVKGVYRFRLGQPFAVFVHRSGGHEQMTVRIPVLRIVVIQIDDHALFSELLPAVCSDQFGVLLKGQLSRKCQNDLPCGLCRAAFLRSVHRVPERLRVSIRRGRVGREEDFVEYDAGIQRLNCESSFQKHSVHKKQDGFSKKSLEPSCLHSSSKPINNR